MGDTPWGSLPVADAHVHFFSHTFYAGLAKQGGWENAGALAGVLDWEIPATDPLPLAAQWVRELDLYGIGRACLIASAPGDEESVAAAVTAYPRRFFGYFMLDPHQPDAVERVTAAGRNPHLHCLCLFPAMHCFGMNDASVSALLEIAARAQLAVFVHCGVLGVGVRKKLGLPSLFDMRFSNPLDLHGVALRFPGVRFIVPHFGAGLFREALMLADMCPNVWLDTSSSNRWMVYEGLDLRGVFRRSLDVVGPGRLLFGTDSSFFPRGWHSAVFEHQTTALYELGLSKQQAEQVLCTNLEALHAARGAAASGSSAL